MEKEIIEEWLKNNSNKNKVIKIITYKDSVYTVTKILNLNDTIDFLDIKGALVSFPLSDIKKLVAEEWYGNKQNN